MIWYYIANSINYALDSALLGINYILAPFGLSAVVTSLPFGTDEALTNALGTLWAIAQFFPPIYTLVIASVIFLVYKIGAAIMKSLLGDRAPI